MDPLGKVGANCFRTHHELTMDLPGKQPLAPSVIGQGLIITAHPETLLCIPVCAMTPYVSP